MGRSSQNRYVTLLKYSTHLHLSNAFNSAAFLPAAKLVIAAHLPIMFIEGGMTATCALFLRKVRPKILEGATKKPLQYQTGITAEKVESAPATLHLERQELQKMIDSSLDKKLKPITNMLAGSMEKEPRLSEILGGIGYIFGLVGVAFYFSNRHRKE